MNTKYYISGILLIALVLRVISLNQSLWIDEATSALTVRSLSYSQIINDFSPGDFHPPFYYLTLKLWNDIFGNSEIALRGLSVIFGLASIYLTYLVGSVFGKKVGLLSALFLTVNGLHIYYSQEARMYSMSVFLVLLLIYLFIKTLKSKNPLYWFLFSFVLVINAFTDYLPNLMIIVFWIYAVFSVRRKYWWKSFLSAHIPLLFFGFLWLPYLSKQVQLGLSVRDEGSLWWNVLGRTDIKNTLLIPVKFIFGRISFTDKVFYFSVSAFLVSLYSLIIYKSYKKIISNKLNLLILFWLTLPIILTAFIGFKISVFSYFRLIFVLPAFIVILALSVMNLSKKWRMLAVIIVLSVSITSSFYYLLNSRFHRENWRELVAYINKESQREEFGVVFASNGQTEGFRYYYGSGDVIIKSDKAESSLEKLWYVRYVQDIFDPSDAVKERIESLGYIKRNVHDFNGIIVWEYENSN